VIDLAFKVESTIEWLGLRVGFRLMKGVPPVLRTAIGTAKGGGGATPFTLNLTP